MHLISEQIEEINAIFLVLIYQFFVFVFVLRLQVVVLTLYAGGLCLNGAFCSDGDGRITGNDATKFFAMSNLSRQDLKQVWFPCLSSFTCQSL
jgi:hypothetical protein